MLTIHFLGLAMGIGAEIGHIFLGMAAIKIEKSENPLPYLKRVRAISPFTLLILILIVILAVLTFQ